MFFVSKKRHEEIVAERNKVINQLIKESSGHYADAATLRSDVLSALITLKHFRNDWRLDKVFHILESGYVVGGGDEECLEKYVYGGNQDQWV